MIKNIFRHDIKPNLNHQFPNNSCTLAEAVKDDSFLTTSDSLLTVDVSHFMSKHSLSDTSRVLNQIAMGVVSEWREMWDCI